MIRDKEIDRLVKYAQALGVKVSFSNNKNTEDAADWTLDGKNITIYTKNQHSKTDTILSLIHEIAHSLDHIHRHNRELDEKFEDALDPGDNGEIGKRKRKIILDSEVAGTEYWHTIYKETDLKFPLWKLYAQMEHDVWQFRFYHETGEFPGFLERKKKRKELYKKHKDVDYE